MENIFEFLRTHFEYVLITGGLLFLCKRKGVELIINFHQHNLYIQPISLLMYNIKDEIFYF